MDYVEESGKDGKESISTPSVGQGHGEDTLKGLKKVSRKALVNKLNHTNFQDGTIILNFQHPDYDRMISINAKPQPCLGKSLVCLWCSDDAIDGIAKSYEFKELIVTNGLKLLNVKTKPRMISKKGICLELPETCLETNARKTERYTCENLKARLIQNSVFYTGSLLDFNPSSLKAKLSATPPQTFQWLNPKARVNLIIGTERDEVLYSGECRIVSQSSGHLDREFVLEPLNNVIQRYKPKEYRSQRLSVTPSPDMTFCHPFTGKMVSLHVIDLSGSGFSVEDSQKNAVLLAGMIIPELELNFADSFQLKCKAQVVYRKIIKNETNGKSIIKCGLALLDMDLDDHRKLIALLHHAENRDSYVCNTVDMDELWDFFFETGFLYPKKYAFLENNKEKIKQTYEKLYTKHPSIARHFIYKEKGIIRGHMSMLRFYDNTWLIHHHAARSSSLIRAGLVVLDQIGRFTYDSHRLYSGHMDYLICYYRPDNEFPNHVFGGAAQQINDPAGCSVDSFTYLHVRKQSDKIEANMPSGWNLEKTTPRDLTELETFYQMKSGGLMLHGLDLLSGDGDRHGLPEEYKKAGLKRERRLFSLKYKNNAKVFFMVDVSNVAINLSDLTNCVKAVVVDNAKLTREVFLAAVDGLGHFFDQKKFPLLVFPDSFADAVSLPVEKYYNLWVLNTQYSDNYFKFIDELKQLAGKVR